MARILALADALVADLNGQSYGYWGMEFTAYRTYVPISDIKDLGTDLDVPVLATGYESTLSGRPRTIEDSKIDVGVQTKLAGDLTTDSEIKAACDPIVTLVQTIGDHYRGRAVGGVACFQTVVTFLYIPKYLDEEKVFRSVLTLTFRGGF